MDTDNRKRPSRPVDANSIVVKTLRMVLCSSRDGVPLKLKKENGRPGILNYLSIDTTFDPCYLSLDSTFNLNILNC